MDAAAQDLLEWYDAHRRELPWRERPDVYWVWLSEVILQQTRVDTGLPYFKRFIDRFPTVEDLADASLDEVLTLWSGLGYYSRARNLHRAAVIVAANGGFPSDVAGLRSLPGIGEYMAGAIASIALGLDEPTVDGNIARVMARLHADSGTRKAMWGHARAHLPTGRAGDFNQALMDLGSMVCTPRNPRCPTCPIVGHCEAHRLSSVAEYPAVKARKKAPVVTMDCAIHVEGHRVWVGRRPEVGLWAGLWALPETAPPDAELVGTFQHVLSHKRIHVSVWVSDAPPPVPLPDWGPHAWLTIGELSERGISALTRKCLEMFQAPGAS